MRPVRPSSRRRRRRTEPSTSRTFRRVTVPLLAPVLSVVFITMIINVLKVFDIVYALAPQSTQANANVIALAMYYTAFQGGGNFGVGSAIAVFLFLLVVILGAMAGYAFAWLDFPGRDWAFIGVIALLVVPLQMALIPMFRLYDKLHLYGTWEGIALFHVAFGLPFAVFLLRNFFVGIPKDILESARIDGASELRIFVRLMLPLGLPAIASLAIFQFLWTWNDLLVALTFGGNTTPITVWIAGQLREFGTSIDIIAPASFISLVVPLIVFFAFQRYFVQGLLAGSVK